MAIGVLLGIAPRIVETELERVGAGDIRGREPPVERRVEVVAVLRGRPVGHAGSERPRSVVHHRDHSRVDLVSLAPQVVGAPPLDPVHRGRLEQELAGDRRGPIDRDRTLQGEPLIVARLGRGEAVDAKRTEAVALIVVQESELVLGGSLHGHAAVVIRPLPIVDRRPIGVGHIGPGVQVVRVLVVELAGRERVGALAAARQVEPRAISFDRAAESRVEVPVLLDVARRREAALPSTGR